MWVLPARRKIVNQVVLFAVAVLLSGWLGVYADSVLPDQPEGETLGMGIWLLMPNVVALLIILLARINWRELGFKPRLVGNGKWYLSAVLIYPVVTTVVLLVGGAANWIDLSSLDIRLFSVAFLSPLLANFIKNIFEETLWRGFLTTRLLKLGLTDWTLYLVVGLTWGMWHLPYYLVFLSASDMQAILPVSRLAFALVAIVTMVCWTVMYVELFRVTSSLWPCIVLHAVEDSFVNPLVISGFIAIAAGKEILVSPVTGVLNSLLFLAVGLAIRTYRQRVQQLPIEQDSLAPKIA